MKIAIIGSRNITNFKIDEYIPKNITEIVSGGAKGIDMIAKIYAIYNNIKITEFTPNYKKYGRNAPLIRNIDIIEYADVVIAFWDKSSKGTKFVIANCKTKKIPIKIISI